MTVYSCLHKITRNTRDTLWNLDINVSTCSLKGILMLFEDPTRTVAPYKHNSELFYNPKITKVEVIVEGEPNQLHSQIMCPYEQ